MPLTGGYWCNGGAYSFMNAGGKPARMMDDTEPSPMLTLISQVIPDPPIAIPRLTLRPPAAAEATRDELFLPILNDGPERVTARLLPSRVPGDLDGRIWSEPIGFQQFTGIDWLRPGEYTVAIETPSGGPRYVRGLAIQPRPRRGDDHDHAHQAVEILVWNGQELLARPLPLAF